ncbi:MAG: lysylphosphatidylglycerol synthase domain-containing protein [Vicingaceae bacterium]|nr:lysylphosphatidylglycerol synthase domain-containing protein [Vicingaceae bacterium]
MVNKVSYKYINLLFRLFLGVGAVIYIYYKIREDWGTTIVKIDFSNIETNYLLLAFLLVFFNWGIEAIKWKYVIRKTLNISFFKAFNYTLTGVTAGLLTPNRIGEVPFRALLLGKKYFKEITLKTLVSSYSQMIITFIIGLCGLMVTYHLFDFGFDVNLLFGVFILIALVMLLLYFKLHNVKLLLYKIPYLKNNQLADALGVFSYKELLVILGLSFLRYLIFSFQYFLAMEAFGIDMINLTSISLIPVCFTVASFIPTILFSEIAVRASVALFIFGLTSDLNISIMAASLMLWNINVAFPALLGLFNLRKIKILSRG